MLAFGLALVLITGEYPDEATRNLPIHDAIEAWARARKLFLDQEGSNFFLRATKGHCYNDVAIELTAYTAKATGKDGHDCTDDERFQMVGFKRPDGSLVWIVTFDSVYGSNIAAYTLKDGKLRPDKELSDTMPTAATMIPAEIQGDSAAAQKVMTSIEPHFFLDEKGLRAQIDAKLMAKLCGLSQSPPAACDNPRVAVLKWNKKNGAFEPDAPATASALTVAIAEAKANAEAAVVATPQAEEAVAEEGAARRPLRQRNVRRQ